MTPTQRLQPPAPDERHLRFGTSLSYRLPARLVRGDGVHVYDDRGRGYLDLFGGAGRCLVGHGNTPVAAAISEQAQSLIVSRHSHPARGRYAERLLALSPPGLDHLSLFSTGSEAVDIGVQLARASTGREGVVVFERAFHGRSSGVAVLTDPGWQAGGQPTRRPSVCRLPYPVVGEPPPVTEAVRQRVAAALATGAIAAVLIEPVQATGGNRAAVPEFLRWLAELCLLRGTLLIFDEVVTGFGRTGHMFAATGTGVTPHIIIAGKGMANGVPVGGVITSAEIAATPPLGQPGGMSSTFGGNPLTIAAAEATLRVLQSADLVSRASRQGAGLLAALRSAIGQHPAVAGIWGTGLMVGIGLRAGAAAAEAVFLSCGLVVGVSGDTIRINPPLVIGTADIDEAASGCLAALDKLVEVAGA